MGPSPTFISFWATTRLCGWLLGKIIASTNSL
jgi:hypothetical protein